MNRRPKVACVTGAGTAPELMAEAVLALDAVARTSVGSSREAPAIDPPRRLRGQHGPGDRGGQP